MNSNWRRVLGIARKMQRKGYRYVVGLSEVPSIFMKEILAHKLDSMGPPRLVLGEMLTKDYPNSRLEYHAPINVHIEAIEMMDYGPVVYPAPAVMTLDEDRHPIVVGQTWNGEPVIYSKPGLSVGEFVWGELVFMSVDGGHLFIHNDQATAESRAVVMHIPED